MGNVQFKHTIQYNDIQSLTWFTQHYTYDKPNTI